MGAWGPAIFSDDLACDIRSDYRELLEDQVPDEEATRRILASYAGLGDEEHLLWLALAATQSRLGRLEPEVTARALAVIDDGIGLEPWAEAGTRELAARTVVLAKLRAELTGEQPPRRALRRPWRHETDLLPGDLLAHTAPSGRVTLFRVLRLHDDREGRRPVVERLAWRGRTIPPGWIVPLIPADWVPMWGFRLKRARWSVSRFRAADRDWADVGLARVGRVRPRPLDAWAGGGYSSWDGLVAEL